MENEKTFYIELEQAGYLQRIFEVKASDEDEAWQKVKDYLLSEYDSYCVTRAEAEADRDANGIFYIEDIDD